MTSTFEATARTRVDALLAKQQQERTELTAALESEEAEAALALRESVRDDAGRALAEAMDIIEAQVRQDRRADRMLAKVESSLPSWADANLPALDPDEADAGRKRMILYLPPAWAGGGREAVVLALVDVTDQVHGQGARARRDRDMAEREAVGRAQRERDHAEREAEALRR